jgi:hypothetical protein
VATRPIPEAARRDPARWSACSSGAVPAGEIERMLTEVGFVEVRIAVAGLSAEAVGLAGPDDLGVVSASVRGVRPRA